ncbi:hypothetical protein AB0F71_18730 [Kitasatospora sp. NPDC028055]|uniref:SCO3933 family regulatory protein n=1 Tax=Kitasatospora sp. NPDC028055 TaxID=3155653 RepID=UPI0034078671
MRTIPVDTTSATAMLGVVRDKVKDFQTGEIAVDKETGAKLLVADVMFVLDGRAEMISVTVPETGLAKGTKPGALVAFTGLVATPWENNFNGQARHGIAFRAAAITAKAA